MLIKKVEIGNISSAEWRRSETEWLKKVEMFQQLSCFKIVSLNLKCCHFCRLDIGLLYEYQAVKKYSHNSKNKVEVCNKLFNLFSNSSVWFCLFFKVVYLIEKNNVFFIVYLISWKLILDVKGVIAKNERNRCSTILIEI